MTGADNQMGKYTITVIFTCFNRREKTVRCIESLLTGNPDITFDFVVLDDNSTDGTREALKTGGRSGCKIKILQGDGSSYWAGGMRQAIAYAKENTDTPYYLLINDDVEFFDGAIGGMIEEAEKLCGRQESGAASARLALVGPMCDEKGNFSYGGIRYTNGIHYEDVHPGDEDPSCDTFNMNCLLVIGAVFHEMPNFDKHYIHSLADFDYGLEMKRRQIPVRVYGSFVGRCPDNDPKGGWTDRSLTRRERLRQKESIKGAPFAPWFYFLRKNFGLRQAILHGFTPYLRILLKR
jgi:GT2 family glycosyltransferase